MIGELSKIPMELQDRIASLVLEPLGLLVAREEGILCIPVNAVEQNYADIGTSTTSRVLLMTLEELLRFPPEDLAGEVLRCSGEYVPFHAFDLSKLPGPMRSNLSEILSAWLTPSIRESLASSLLRTALTKEFLETLASDVKNLLLEVLPFCTKTGLTTP